MLIIVAGSRDLTDYQFVENKLLEIISREQYETETPTWELEIISGHARGTDALGEKFSEKWLGKKAKMFPAKWDDLETPPVFLKQNAYGKWMNALAGENRNREMGEYVVENGGGICIGFLFGKSSGTRKMLSIAKKLGIKTYKIDYEKEKENERQSNNPNATELQQASF